MPTDPLTFGLAWLGYTLLAIDFAGRAGKRCNRGLSALTAVVVIAHVVCVYAFRFEGSIAAAWEKSAPGFVIFNSALCAIAAAPLASEPWCTRCTLAAFPVVSVGVLGVPFRYPELAVLGAPVFVTFGAAVVVAGVGWRRSRRHGH